MDVYHKHTCPAQVEIIHLLMVLVKKTFILVKKNLFMGLPAAPLPFCRSILAKQTCLLVKKNIFFSQKKPFRVSTEAYNPRQCTHPYSSRVQWAPSWVLDAGGQSGWVEFLYSWWSKRLFHMAAGCFLHCWQAGSLRNCIFSMVPGPAKRFFLTNKNVFFD